MPESSRDSEKDLAVLNWISDQLTALAEGFGESLTEERVEIYVRGLVDIPRDRLQVAFRKALYELKYFPKLAELRNLGGGAVVEQNKVQAEAAWNHVNEYLRKWGVDLIPIYSGGIKTTAPQLDARTDYALRTIGGLHRLNQVDIESWPFMQRDFCEAYARAPVAELMAPELAEQFGEHKLSGNERQLAKAKTMEQRIAKQGTPEGQPHR